MSQSSLPRSQRLRFGHLVVFLSAFGLGWLARHVWRQIYGDKGPLPENDVEPVHMPGPVEHKRGMEAFWKAYHEADQRGLPVWEFLRLICEYYTEPQAQDDTSAVAEGDVI